MASSGEISPAPSIIDTLGEEIVRIVAPVSLCMLLVVLLIASLSTPFTFSPFSSVAASESASSWQENLSSALVSSLIFVVVITAVTFLLFALFYLRLTAFLRYYMVFSCFFVLLSLGGQLFALLVSKFDLSLDFVTFSLLLFNFAGVGAAAVMPEIGFPISFTQGYLVAVGVLVAFWFTMLPEWTTWSLLIAMAVYDVAAVLLPVGPLRLLVELAISRDEPIPALVYEARPVLRPADPHVNLSGDEISDRDPNSARDPEIRGNNSDVEPGISDRDSSPDGRISEEEFHRNSDLRIPIIEEESRQVPVIEENFQNSALTTPLMATERQRSGSDDSELISLSSSGGIKLGLGDFIFYSVLVGRAAMYDFLTVYACYLAIIAGLGVTLLLLGYFRRALPALPVSIALGVVFYLLARFLLEEFLVQCSTNLIQLLAIRFRFDARCR